MSGAEAWVRSKPQKLALCTILILLTVSSLAIVPTTSHRNTTSQTPIVTAQTNSPRDQPAGLDTRTAPASSRESRPSPKNLPSTLSAPGQDGLFQSPAQAVGAGSRRPEQALSPISPTVTVGSSNGMNLIHYVGSDGLNQTGSISLSCGTRVICIPPDVQVAAGPNQVVEMVNNAGAVFSKQSVLTSLFSLNSFYSTRDQLSDPKVLYDVNSGRWFTSIIDINTDSVFFAVSTSSNFTTFYFYSLTPGLGTLPDQPIIGVSSDKFVVSVNDFGRTFNGAQYWVFNKSEILAGASKLDNQTFGPDPNYASIHPANSLGPTTTQYMVSSNYQTGVLTLFSITGTPGVGSGSNVTKLNLAINSFYPPYAVIQPSTLDYLDPGDARVLDAAWFQGKLWYTFGDGCTPAGDTVPRACARLGQIDTTVSPAAIKQDFDISAAGKYIFYPAITIDASGNLAVVYGYASTVDYPSLAVTGQAVGDPVNTYRIPQTIAFGTTPDTTQENDGGRARYGDYFGASLDPSDTTKVWVAGEYHNVNLPNCRYSGNCWDTLVATMRVTGASFTMTSSSILTVTATASNSSTVNLAGFGGFTGSVTLSALSFPSGITVAFGPPSVNLKKGSGSSVATITAGPTSVGNYSLVINGISGSLINSIFVLIIVRGYTASLSPASLVVSTIIPSSGSSTVTLTSFNNFAGSVLFAGSVSNSSIPNRPTVSFNPASVSLTASGTASSTVTVSTVSSTPMGNYTVTVTATSNLNGNQITQTTTLSVQVPHTGFAISPTNPNPYILIQTTGSDTVQLTSLSNFTGTINLSLSADPRIGASLSQTTVSLSGGQTQNVILYLTPSNQYPNIITADVNVTGTSGSSSHKIVVLVTPSGEVCLNDPTTTGTPPCPSTPYIFNGPLTHPSTQLKVGVYIQNTDNIAEGFEVILKTNNTVLTPVGVDASTSLVPDPYIFAECINGHVVVLECSSSNIDGPGTLDVTVGIGAGPCCTSVDVSGLLFYAIFNITGVSGSTPVGFQSCPGLSSSSPGSCVFIINGGGVLSPIVYDPQALQGATFANGQIPYVTVTSNLSTLGPVLAGTTAHATITVTSRNGYPTSSDSGLVWFTTSAPSNVGLSAVTLQQNQSLTDALSATYSSAGNFTFTIYGAYSVTNQTGCPFSCITGTSTLIVTLTLDIVVQGVQLTVTPASMTLLQGGSSSVAYRLTSLNGFSGRVNLTQVITPVQANDPVETLNVTSLTLTPGGSAGVLMTVSTSSFTVARNYGVGFKAVTTIGSTQQKIVIVRVQGFSISASPSAGSLVLSGTSTVSTVTLKSLNGFAGNVSLSAASSPTGPVTSIWPYTASLTSGSISNSTLSISAGGATAGTYSITITAISGTLSHLGNFTLTVTGDYSVSTNTGRIIVAAGSSGTVTYNITSQNAFSGEVDISPVANVTIHAIAVNDTSCRTFGLVFNQPLASNFWTSQPSSVVGTSCAGSFNFSQFYGMTGPNYLEFGVNSTTGHWRVNIYVDGVLLANVNTDLNTHVHAAFQIGNLATTFSVGYTGYVNVPAGGSASGYITIQTTTTTAAGNYTVTVTAAGGGVVHTVSFIVQVFDFSLSAPSSVQYNSSGVYSFTVTLASLNGFSGNVTLSMSPSSPSVSISCNPVSITITKGGTGTSSCTATVTAAGIYTVTVTGTSSGLSHSATVTVGGDFSVSAPGSITCISGGRNCSFSTTVTSLNGWSGTISLSTSAGSITPTSITLSPGGSASATVNFAPGPSTVYIAYTSGSISHQTSTHVVYLQ